MRTSVNGTRDRSRVEAMKIIYHKPAAKTLERLDPPAKTRIKSAVSNLPSGDVARITGVPGLFRLRVGEWRILFSFLDIETIVIEKVLPRGSAYKQIWEGRHGCNYKK
jgi:mRNA interferase RelE/StbE